MGKIRRFLGVFALLFGVVFATNSFAGGYTCDDLKVYTSCNADYFLNDDGVCESCPSGCTCSGGTVAPNCGYTVTYDINGGSGTAPASETCQNGTGCALDQGSHFERPGYQLVGWSTDKNATTGSFEVTFTSDTTVYAIWSPCGIGYFKASAHGAIDACDACTSITGSDFYNKTDAVGATDATACYGETAKGTYIETAYGKPTDCPAGSYCEGGTKVYYGKTGGNTSCPGGYDDGGTGLEDILECAISCTAGQRVNQIEGTCTTDTGGWMTYAHTVKLGNVSPIVVAPLGFTNSVSGTSLAQLNTHNASNTVVPQSNNKGTIPAGMRVGGYRLSSNGGNLTVKRVRVSALDDDVSSDFLELVEVGAFAVTETQPNVAGMLSPLNSLIYSQEADDMGGAMETPWGVGVLTDGVASYKPHVDDRVIMMPGSYLEYRINNQALGFIQVSLGDKLTPSFKVEVLTSNDNWVTIFDYTAGLTKYDYALNKIYGTKTLMIPVIGTTPCAAGSARTAWSNIAWSNLGSTGYATCIECDRGKYQDLTGQSSCKSCAATAGDFYANTQTTGSTSIGQCYGITSPGEYVATAKSAPQTCGLSGGDSNMFCPGDENVFYGATGGAGECPEPTDEFDTLSVADYGTVTSIDTPYFPEHTQPWKSESDCRVAAWVSTSKGHLLHTASLLDGQSYTGNIEDFWTVANAGYYLSGWTTSSEVEACYSSIETCYTGSWCPGVNIDGEDWELWNDELQNVGINSCPAGYEYTWGQDSEDIGYENDFVKNNGYQTNGATKESQCFARLELGQYIGTAKGAVATCPAGHYCGGEDRNGAVLFVRYGSVLTPTACPVGTYQPATGMYAYPEDETCAEKFNQDSDLYEYCVNENLVMMVDGCFLADEESFVDSRGATEQTSCRDAAGDFYSTTGIYGALAITDCYGETTAGYYMVAGDTTETECETGFYCPGDIPVYYGEGDGDFPCPEINVPSSIGDDVIDYDFYDMLRATTQDECRAYYEYNAPSGIITEVGYYDSDSSTYTNDAFDYSLSANPGYWLENSDADEYFDAKECPAGSYCPGVTKEELSATPSDYEVVGRNLCPVGSYNSATGQSVCVVCQNGTTTSATGQKSCDATCATKNNYVSSWKPADWNNGTPSDICTINTCGAGAAYSSGNGGRCTECGAGTYQSSTSHTSTTCQPVDTGCYANATASTTSCPHKVQSGCYADTTGSTTICPKSCATTAGEFYSKTNGDGATNINACYGITSPGEWIDENGALAECSTEGGVNAVYCPGDQKVYYGDTVTGQYDCPSPENYTFTLPTETYGTMSESQDRYFIDHTDPWTSAGDCTAVFPVGTTKGTVNHAARFDADSGNGYTITVSDVWTAAKPGYYMNGWTEQEWAGGYSSIELCPSGSYCPGANADDDEAWDSGMGTVGLKACSIGTYQPNTGQASCLSCVTNAGSFYVSTKTTGSKSINQCYGITEQYMYVDTDGEQQDCPMGSYCPGAEQLFYPETGGDYSCPDPEEYNSYEDNNSAIFVDNDLPWGDKSECTIATDVDLDAGNMISVATYNETDGKYGDTLDETWLSANPGYYLSGYTDTAIYPSYGYTSAKLCEINNYCGGTVANPDVTENVLGLNPCKTGYYQDAMGQTSCKPMTYTISFDAKGGTGGQTANVTATYDAAMPTIDTTAPVYPGYSFTGWYDAQGKPYYSATGDAMYTKWTETSDVQLFAGWELGDASPITYKTNGGVFSGEPQTTCNAETETFDLPQISRPGYTFVGWTDVSGQTVASVPKGTCTEPLTFTANWTVITYTIKYNLDNGTNAASNKATYIIDDTPITLANPTKTGYSFGGWYTDSGFVNKVTQIAKGTARNYELWAKWTPITYTITYSNMSGATNAASNPATYTIAGTPIALAKPTKTGYVFNGWTGDNVANSQIVAGTTGNITVTANWTPTTFTVRFDTAEANVNLSDLSCTYDKPCGPAPTVSMNYKTFAGWYRSSDYTGVAINAGDDLINLLSNGGEITLYAKWSQNVVSCEAGYYFDSGVKKQCTGNKYCEGNGTIDEGTSGCYKECPLGGSTTVSGATAISQCRKTIVEDGTAHTFDNGSANWDCGYTNTSAGYNTGCKLNVLTCDAGYYYNSSKQTGCTAVGSGYYSPAPTLGEAVKDELSQQSYSCPDKATDVNVGSDLPRTDKTDCYKSCSLTPSDVANSTSITAAKSKVFSNADGKYPVCSYTLTCDTGYTAQNGETPKCVAKKYTITLDKNGGSGNASASIECTFDSGMCNLPTASGLTRVGYTNQNKWCTKSDGSGICYSAGSVIKENISANGTDITLFAIWVPKVFKIELDTNGATENASLSPIYLKYETGWFKDSGATQALTSLVNLPQKTGYDFGGFGLNGIAIIKVSGEMVTSQEALTATTENATAKAAWSSGIVICEPGYYYTGTGGFCTLCQPNHWCPGGTYPTDTGNQDGQEMCPNGGLSSGGASATNSGVCYMPDMFCAVQNGAGVNTCDYDEETSEYSANCTACMINTCDEQYYIAGTSCEMCPSGYVCDEQTRTGNNGIANSQPKLCGASFDGRYPKSDKGSTSFDQCYADCSVLPNVLDVTGRDYYGLSDTCDITRCESGYYLQNDMSACELCPANSICDEASSTNLDGVPGPDGMPRTCDALTDGTHQKSDAGSTKIDQCYKLCEPFEILGGIATPVSGTVSYGQECKHMGVSESGNPCEIKTINGVITCIETSCNPDYELINGRCHKCERENATAYKANGNCLVAKCHTGYHPDGDQCSGDVKTCSAPNAVDATQTWDAKSGAFGICKITECADGYHIEANACVPNVESCFIEHGTGTREWDDRRNTWGECVATSCVPGYTNDSYDSDEPDKQCGRCRNAKSVLGQDAVSSYASGCQIATCLYQGELYNLENNECVPICPVTEYSDETGTMRWNPKTKKCERDCKEGYMSW